MSGGLISHEISLLALVCVYVDLPLLFLCTAEIGHSIIDSTWKSL